MPSRSSAHLNHYLCPRHLAGPVQQSAGVRCAACRATAAGRRGDPRAQGWRRRRHRRAQGAPEGSAIGRLYACPTSCTPSQRLHGMSLDTGAQQVAVCKACGINFAFVRTDSHRMQVLTRPPRGNTVCDYHNISRKQLARVQFAELVQVGVRPLRCTLISGCTAHLMHLLLTAAFDFGSGGRHRAGAQHKGPQGSGSCADSAAGSRWQWFQQSCRQCQRRVAVPGRHPEPVLHARWCECLQAAAYW